MSERYAQLQQKMSRILRLSQAAALLGWDQQTYMPPGAAHARAEQMATLSELIHEMFVSEETGNLIAQAEADAAGMDGDSDMVRTLQTIRRDYDRETKLPTDLVAELSRHETLAQEIWMRARAENNFETFAPALEKMMELTRQKAEYLGYTAHIYDALLDIYERGMTQADAAAMFEDIKPTLVKLTHAIAQSAHPVDDRPLYGTFPIDKQRELTLKVVGALGFDLQRGRQDEAVHPFCSNASRDDVRLTTRFDETFLSQGLYSSLHEAGHGLYEQGSPAEYEGTSLAGGVSLGMHESQSRLWENQIGRSRAFVHWLFPTLCALFPDAYSEGGQEAFYRAINKVTPSLIRVEADEVTYNLHIMLRFELECDLLTGTLAVRDLPDAWNAKMEAYLGITPPDNARGCLQDVHWSCGLIGYFPTYSIGNLLSAQLFQSARKALPDLDRQIERGEFAPLLDWLRANVHGYGSKFTPGEVILKATGEPLTSLYYADYLTDKYSDIYGLTLK
jgi:carboxypeptidase Taq